MDELIVQNNIEEIDDYMKTNETIPDMVSNELLEEDKLNIENTGDMIETSEEVNIDEVEKAEEELGGNNIELKVDNLVEQVAILNSLFEKKMLVDGQKNKIIESQSDELQNLREGMYEKILKPLLCDVIDIADDIHRMLRAYASKSDETISKEKFISVLEIYESDIEDILEKYGMNVYICPKEVFDPQKQKIVKIVQTDDEEKNKYIAERITKGFELDGKIIRPEKVNVYKYQEQESTCEKNNN